MTDALWQCAHDIARELVECGCDPNEVHKAFVYLRVHKDGERFFRFLETLAKSGHLLSRSTRTMGYYKAMWQVCRRHLDGYRSHPSTMQQVLGWAVRLMRFYTAQQPQNVQYDGALRPRRPENGRQRGRP